jgi:hypothetical protein
VHTLFSAKFQIRFEGEAKARLAAGRNEEGEMPEDESWSELAFRERGGGSGGEAERAEVLLLQTGDEPAVALHKQRDTRSGKVQTRRDVIENLLMRMKAIKYQDEGEGEEGEEGKGRRRCRRC